VLAVSLGTHLSNRVVAGTEMEDWDPGVGPKLNGWHRTSSLDANTGKVSFPSSIDANWRTYRRVPSPFGGLECVPIAIRLDWSTR
jgi:hypothetical protein